MAFLGNLQQRERSLIKWALMLVIASAVYVTILEPRYQRLNALRQQVPAGQQDLAWMKAQIDAHRDKIANRESSGSLEKLPILTIVEQTASGANLRTNISRMQPDRDGAIRVWFDDVYFDPWLRWLEQVRGRGIRVSAANVTLAEEGKVNVRLTLVQSS